MAEEQFGSVSGFSNLFSFKSRVDYAIERKYRAHTAHCARYFLAQPLNNSGYTFSYRLVLNLLTNIQKGVWESVKTIHGLLQAD